METHVKFKKQRYIMLHCRVCNLSPFIFSCCLDLFLNLKPAECVILCLASLGNPDEARGEYLYCFAATLFFNSIAHSLTVLEA